jgi:hypothetical protein
MFMPKVDPADRDEFFAPIKHSADVVRYGSDHYQFDPSTYSLVNRRPGHVPSFGAFIEEHPWYKNLRNVEWAFDGSSMIDLDELHIAGDPVRFSRCVLRGVIDAHNASGKIVSLGDILNHGFERDLHGRPVLEDVRIEVGPEGVRVEPLYLAGLHREDRNTPT